MMQGNWLSELEIRQNGAAQPASGPATFALVEAKCRDMLVLINFDNAGVGNNIDEIALGDESDGSDATALDLTGILDAGGAPATDGIGTTTNFAVLLKNVCRKYVRVTAVGASGNVRMLTAQVSCRNAPRTNDNAETGGPAEQKAFTVQCTCPE